MAGSPAHMRLPEGFHSVGGGRGRARMTPETVTLIRYRVARAGEALAEATLLLAHDHVDSGGASGS